MNIEIREYTQDDVKDMIEIWNEVVEKDKEEIIKKHITNMNKFKMLILKLKKYLMNPEVYAKTIAIEIARIKGVKVGKDCRFFSKEFSTTFHSKSCSVFLIIICHFKGCHLICQPQQSILVKECRICVSASEVS